MFELFRQSGNELFRDGYTLQSSNTGAFGFDWTGRRFYANPVYENAFIHRTLEKALDDHAKSPHDTEFTILVPRWTDSSWWHLTRGFEVEHVYDVGSVMFSAPVRGTFNTDTLEPAGEEGGADRVIINGTQWPVIVLRKTSHTITTMDDNMLFHMRTGHAGQSAVHELIARTDIHTGLDLSRDKTCKCSHCTICQTANMTRPQSPASVSDPSSHDLYSLVYSDIFGPVRVPSHRGYRYMIHFTDARSRHTRVYFMRARS
jgi:hypothetical protein